MIVNIPDHISFLDLRVERDSQTGEISANVEIIKQILRDNGLPLHEDIVVILIRDWYIYHRAHGGDPVPAMEQIIAEAEIEMKTGVRVFGGSGEPH